MVETIMGAEDYLEQYFATNIVFEPLVGELFRSSFMIQVAGANGDSITPPVISAAEADYERNLANTIDLFHLLRTDEEHAANNKKLFKGWFKKYGALAEKAATGLQPIWSQPHSKPFRSQTLRRKQPNGLPKSPASSASKSLPTNKEKTMSTVARDATQQNIFKSMDAIKFEQTDIASVRRHHE